VSVPPNGTRPQPPNGSEITPLILEKNEGERRVWRPVEGLTGELGLFMLKVDPHNGGSSKLVFGTEDLPPGGKIEARRQPVLFLDTPSFSWRVENH
jgi:hypothetical protein